MVFNRHQQHLFCLFLAVFCVLTGCASSNVSREAASNVDIGVQNAKNMTNFSNSDLGEAYQIASQSTKGALLGGTAGAIAGGLTSGVGVLPGAAGGAILGASYGSYIDSQTTLQDQLDNRGITVIVLGDEVLVVVPSEDIFHQYSPKLIDQGYSTLALVSRYINQYTKTLVKISVYTDDTGSKRFDLALSQQQAEQVSRTLQAAGIDTRVLYAQGYGSTHFVVRKGSGWESENNRVEITLEKITTNC